MWQNDYDIELLRVFEVSIIGHKEWINGVYWSKYITCFSVLDRCDHKLVLYASQRKISCQIVVVLAGMYCWATVAQISLNWCFPCCFSGEALCLSWLLDPSLSVKRNPYFIILFWLFTLCEECHESVWVIQWYRNTKKMSAVVYIMPSVFISFYFLPFWGDLFCFNWLACFTFLWLLFGNKILWKNSL